MDQVKAPGVAELTFSNPYNLFQPCPPPPLSQAVAEKVIGETMNQLWKKVRCEEPPSTPLPFLPPSPPPPSLLSPSSHQHCLLTHLLT